MSKLINTFNFIAVIGSVFVLYQSINTLQSIQAHPTSSVLSYALGDSSTSSTLSGIRQ
jgi:uncharacterized membrane protein